jgi:hypothetical protein
MVSPAAVRTLRSASLRSRARTGPLDSTPWLSRRPFGRLDRRRPQELRAAALRAGEGALAPTWGRGCGMN